MGGRGCSDRGSNSVAVAIAKAIRLWAFEVGAFSESGETVRPCLGSGDDSGTSFSE